ncbi:hypothetical protein [Phormidium sp. CCY1219]|uniref:hypothetical protein n=1 Tax=Phormidium sp. CCY1219 TaxID=2886104 RepID=UPI002D1E699C|nr:hypothetical protein [Phormidium sp. CCY1219]MEB3830400.1 hypothetical protein [Phormidium sp. CCY1219]
MNDEQRSQTIKIQTLIRAMEDLDTAISLDPQMPVLYPMQEVNAVPAPPHSPELVYSIRLEVWIVLVVHFVVLWVMKKR